MRAAAFSESKSWPAAASIAFAFSSDSHPSTCTRWSAFGDGTSNCSAAKLPRTTS